MESPPIPGESWGIRRGQEPRGPSSNGSKFPAIRGNFEGQKLTFVPRPWGNTLLQKITNAQLMSWPKLIYFENFCLKLNFKQLLTSPLSISHTAKIVSWTIIYPEKWCGQHVTSTGERKNLSPLTGVESLTFRTPVGCSNHWAWKDSWRAQWASSSPSFQFILILYLSIYREFSPKTV